MRVPVSWLKEYVKTNLTAEAIAERLTSVGLEVDGVEYAGGQIGGIVVGKIESVQKHKDADKLLVCMLNVGCKDNLVQIVTGAKNVSVGDLVPVALDSATIANGKQIFAGEIRGAKSYGMLCSGDELGITECDYLGAGADGILILNSANIPKADLSKHLKVGECILKVLGRDEYVLDVSVLANRPDCQSVFGVAREVSAATNSKLKELDVSFATDKSLRVAQKIINECLTDCSSYTAHFVDNISVGNSPKWLKHHLKNVGVNSINNIVDISNYVLFEVGQPLHMFDADKIDGAITVRRAREGEKFVGLGGDTGVKLTLSKEDIVIADDKKILALAGILGGLCSSVSATTTRVVIEAANFSKALVRKTSRRLGLSTDSSRRFEKGVDNTSVEIGLNRALHLLQKISPGAKISAARTQVATKPKKASLVYALADIEKKLGISIKADTQIKILNSLGFGANITSCKTKINCIIPHYRQDIETYEDITEEIIRIYGFEKLVPTLLANSCISLGKNLPANNKMAELKVKLIAKGFLETITYSFISEKDLANLGMSADFINNNTIHLQNPLTEEFQVMRPTLLASLLKVVASNLSKRNLSARLFEVGKTYLPSKASGEKVASQKTKGQFELPTENKKLIFLEYGAGADFFSVKSVLDTISDVFGVRYKVVDNVNTAENSYFHPYQSASIVLDCASNKDSASKKDCDRNKDSVSSKDRATNKPTSLGTIGTIHPSTLQNFGINVRVVVCEICLDTLFASANKAVAFSPISKYPSVQRDLSFILKDTIRAGDVIDLLEQIKTEKYNNILQDITLQDIYKGEQIKEGHKSFMFNFTFNSLQRTLKDAEINEAMGVVADSLVKTYNVEIRDA